jgi:hypothetical protein
MATRKQRTAIRRNAQLSTGPKTPEGKAAVRLNALSFQGACRELQRLQAARPCKAEVPRTNSKDKWIGAHKRALAFLIRRRKHISFLRMDFGRHPSQAWSVRRPDGGTFSG